MNSADAVRNMAQIVQKHLESTPLVVVVSAMGKTTNLLEKLVPGVSSKEEAVALRQQLEDYRTQWNDYRTAIESLLYSEGEHLMITEGGTD